MLLIHILECDPKRQKYLRSLLDKWAVAKFVLTIGDVNFLYFGLFLNFSEISVDHGKLLDGFFELVLISSDSFHFLQKLVSFLRLRKRSYGIVYALK